jgi:hypothetical protein
MAKTAITANEKTVLIAIIAGLVLVAGWAGVGAICGFTGTVNLPATTSIVLTVIAAVNLIMIGGMVHTIRKS